VWKLEYILAECAVAFSVATHDFVVISRLQTSAYVIGTFRRVVCESNISTYNVDHLSGKLTFVQSEDVSMCFVGRATTTKFKRYSIPRNAAVPQ